MYHYIKGCYNYNKIQQVNLRYSPGKVTVTYKETPIS